jgi:hypothetical protein
LSTSSPSRRYAYTPSLLYLSLRRFSPNNLPGNF